MSMKFKNFFNFFNRHQADDQELTDIANIIRETPLLLQEKNNYTALMKEGDTVFEDRLQKNKQALTMNFWESHFELETFNKYPQLSGHILDFGCGSGHLDILFARKGYNITGVDVSPVAIKISEYLRNKEQDSVKARLAFVETDITMPYNGMKYDCIWSTQVFEHIKNPAPIMAGLRQYAKPGAYFLICVPFGNAYDDPGHCNHFYSKADLSSYLEPVIKLQDISIDEPNQVMRALCII